MCGIVKVIKNTRLGCFEYEFQPTKAWKEANPAEHPELMFTPHDTYEEAYQAGIDYARHIGAVFVG